MNRRVFCNLIAGDVSENKCMDMLYAASWGFVNSCVSYTKIPCMNRYYVLLILYWSVKLLFNHKNGYEYAVANHTLSVIIAIGEKPLLRTNPFSHYLYLRSAIEANIPNDLHFNKCFSFFLIKLFCDVKERNFYNMSLNWHDVIYYILWYYLFIFSTCATKTWDMIGAHHELIEWTVIDEKWGGLRTNGTALLGWESKSGPSVFAKDALPHWQLDIYAHLLSSHSHTTTIRNYKILWNIFIRKFLRILYRQILRKFPPSEGNGLFENFLWYFLFISSKCYFENSKNNMFRWIGSYFNIITKGRTTEPTNEM